VESTLGRGSRFRVEVPAQAADASEVVAGNSTLEVANLEPGQPDYRILIVEDQPENWLLLQRLLQAAGFPVRVAEDGAKAVETFRLWRPHFIWMDLGLPVLSGLEAARRIRQLEGGAALKIVAVTASAFASQRDEVLAAGFDDFLRKPYRPREIFDCMARHLGVRYRYRTKPKAAAGNPPFTLRPANLAVLPAAMRDELESAVVSLDPRRIALVVARVSEENAALGSVLGRLADEFAYTQIHEALQSCKNNLTKASS
jgi:CheY-like chemotaxis protein